MNRSFVCALTLLVVFASGCVSGPKNPDSSVTKAMNGENYAETAVLGGVPVLKRGTFTQNISGIVTCGEGLSKVPVNHAKISLTSGSQIVSTTATAPDGKYILSFSPMKDAAYSLTASAKCGQATAALPKSVDKRLTGVDFTLK